MKCTHQNCDLESFEHVGGIPYCKAHRDELLYGELHREFLNWNASAEPPGRFKYLLGRLGEEFTILGDSFLTAARIRDRGFTWVKESDGGTFEITRHPGAWGAKTALNRVVQKWQFFIGKRELHLLNKRKFKGGDFDW